MGNHTKRFNAAAGESAPFTEFFTTTTAVSKSILSQRAEEARIAEEEAAEMARQEEERAAAAHARIAAGGLDVVLRAMAQLPDVERLNFRVQGPLDHYYSSHDITVEIKYEEKRPRRHAKGSPGHSRNAIHLEIHESGEVDVTRYDRTAMEVEPEEKARPEVTRYVSLKEAVDRGLADFIATVAPERVTELQQKILELQLPAPEKRKGIRAFMARFQH